LLEKIFDLFLLDVFNVWVIVGIDSLSINMKERTLTVIGDADPLSVANLIRTKFKCAKLLSAGPVPPPEPKEENKAEENMVEAEKPKEEQKEEKNEEEKREENSEEEKKKKSNEEEQKDGKIAAESSQAMPYQVCDARCFPPCSACSSRPEIPWPRYHHPGAPNEIWYVWNEDKQDSCIIM
jgi:hypothetical protein